MNGAPLFCDPDRTVGEAMRAATGAVGTVFQDLGALRDHLLKSTDDDTLVLGPGVADDEAFALAEYMQFNRSSLGVVLVRKEVTTPLLQQALRAGVFEVVHERDGLSLGAAVQRSSHVAAAKRTHAGRTPAAVPVAAQPGQRAVVVTVFSTKGGCGKTTFATNLAAVLSDKGRARVCIVDLDLAFGDVAITMHLVPVHTIADAIPMNGQLDPGAIQALLTQHSSGLSAIVAPTEPSVSESITPTLVSHLLGVLQAEFEYLVIDTSPDFNDQVLAALDIADVIAMVVTPEVPALKNLKVSLETLAELGYSQDRMRLVLNRAETKVGLAVAEVEKAARMRCAARIPSSRDVPSSVNRGMPIVLDDPRHPVSQAIRQFATTQVPRVENSLDGTAQTGGQPTIDVREERRGLIKKRRQRTA